MWPLELGLGTLNPRFVAWPVALGLGTLNPRFVAWPVELGLGTHNPRFVAWPVELGLGTLNPRFVVWPVELGLGTRNPRFFAWPIALGLGTRNSRFVVWPLELGLGTHNPRFVVWPLELGLGTLNPRFVVWPLELGLGTLNSHGNIFPLIFGRAPKQPLRMTRKMMLGRRLIYVHCDVKSTLPQNLVNVICIIVRNVLTRTLVGTRSFIEQSCLYNVSEQIWWNKVAEVIQICFSYSMLCMDGWLLHLVGKRLLLVYPGAPYGNGKTGDSIGESHHKSSVQGKFSSFALTGNALAFCC